MLRELMVNNGDVAPASYIAETELKTGAPVVVDKTTGKVTAPSTETASDIYVVDKERYATGVYAGLTNMSDYHENFNTVEANQPVKLCVYDAQQETFATSEYDETIVDGAKGKRVAAKDGKWTVATTTASKYVFVDFFIDNGHKLAMITVSDTAVQNS